MRVIVIGAGASGMLSAILAAKEGHSVILLEKNDRPGKKLMATGNGRCNFLNRRASWVNYHGEDPLFAKEVLKAFPPFKVEELFADLGLETVELDRGKLFPASLQAKSVLDVLCRAMRKYGVRAKYRSLVRKIEKRGEEFVVESEEMYRGDRVIFAVGGSVMKKSGSDGSAYVLVQRFGHQITAIMPGIVKLNLKEGVKDLEGVKFTGRVYFEGTVPNEETGDVLFTRSGISGQAILNLSASLLRQKVSVFYLDVLPFWKDAGEKIAKRMERFGEYSFYDLLVGVIHEKLINFFLARAGIDSKEQVGAASVRKKEALAKILTACPLQVAGAYSLDDGQVTLGGVDTSKVNPQTLESKLCPGLFFTGEVLDVDGDCGGYNLGWAWASAMAAVKGMKG